MLDMIRNLFGGDGDETEADRVRGGSLEGAAAALMIEAATLDGTFDERERSVIVTALCRRFGLSPEDAEALVEEGHRDAHDASQIYDVVRTIREALEPQDRVRVVEVLWEIAYADGEVHDYEANLVRRVSGLLYVPDQESGAARKRVIERLKQGTVGGAPGSQ
jgi:uncharacterized tellurite resistance protein B-like protein